jgi:cytidyltransferase-like protein
MKYQYVCLGGTFDHFHAGHQSFLKAIAAKSQHLLIGITQAEMTEHKKFSTVLEPYEIRYQAVKKFCRTENIECELVPLTDQYGPTLTNSKLQAIFVTPDTEKGAHAINSARLQRGLQALLIEKVELLKARDGNIVSSERIRNGQISRQGDVYANVFLDDLKLNSEQRQYFSKIHGTVLTDLSAYTPPQKSFVVGDTSFETFEQFKWSYKLAVIDFRKQRQAYIPSSELKKRVDLKVKNPAGVITTELVEALQQVTSRNLKILAVDGEEDLAAVALVLLLPLGCHIYYGQPDIGIVEVVITEQLKQDFYQALL